MPSIRLMHFADVHFGVENYGRFDPATGLNSRLVDFRDALNNAIDTALAAGIELALFAGDAYKTRDPNQTQQREFARCLGRLTEQGIPVVMLAGNHDIPNTKGRANTIEIFGALAGRHLRIFDVPGCGRRRDGEGQSRPDRRHAVPHQEPGAGARGIQRQGRAGDDAVGRGQSTSPASPNWPRSATRPCRRC